MPPGLTSPAHLSVLIVVALVVLGPERLPGALRQVAQFVAAVRGWVDEVNHAVTSAVPVVGAEVLGKTGADPQPLAALPTVELPEEVRT